MPMTATAAELNRLIGTPTVAAIIGVDRRTLRRMIVSGRFPEADVKLSKTLIRWKRSTVDRWIDNRAHETSRGA